MQYPKYFITQMTFEEVGDCENGPKLSVSEVELHQVPMTFRASQRYIETFIPQDERANHRVWQMTDDNEGNLFDAQTFLRFHDEPPTFHS